MKNKFRLWLNIVTICLCVCAIAIGVYSATTANLNVGGKIAFSAHNCKVDITAYIYGHAEGNDDDGLPVAEAQKEPLNGGNALSIEGGVSTTEQCKLDLGTRYFTDMASTDGSAEDIVIGITVKNTSAYKITAKTGTHTLPTRVTASANQDAADIDPQGTTTFVFTLELQPDTPNGTVYSSITTLQDLVLALEFEKWEEIELLKWDNGIGWHIEMGSYNETAVKWVPIAESTDGGTTFTAFDGKTYTTSNEECKPQSGNKYYFLSYNILPVNYSGTSNNYMSFNFYDNTDSTSETYRKAWYWDEDAGTTAFYKDSSDAYVNANDYSVSNVRNYLNGETAYRYYTTPNYTPNTAQKLTTINELYGLSTDAVFNGDYIDARSISDLYTNIQASSSASDATYETPAVPTTTKGTGSDKLWLLSHEEYYKYVYTNTAVHNLNVTNTSYQTLKSGVPLGGTSAARWWLRSPHTTAYFAYGVNSAGGVNFSNVYGDYGVRPAFQITIPA